MIKTKQITLNNYKASISPPIYIIYPTIFFKNPKDRSIIIILAIKIPIIVAIKAFFLFISNTEAIKHPVHAPVPGNGIPTKSTRPQNPYFSI